MDVTDLKVGIWGYGKEGKSLHHYLKTMGNYKELLILQDQNFDDSVQEIPIISGNEARQKMKSGYFDLIFKSPGVSLYKPEIGLAKSKGTKFSSATNLWFSKKQKTKKIVVTGTKGKSTVASLLYHVMKKIGVSVSLAGNVGLPLLDLKEETDYTIIELSSYQLADLDYAPDIFVITNLFPEHLQWHITHENYFRDKLSPLRLGEDLTVIANAKNKTLKEELLQTSKKIIWVNQHDCHWINTQLKGQHNQENIQAVLAVCKLLELGLPEVVSCIATFKPLAHRMQEFLSKEGLTCVNDTISTTPESTIAAMKVYQNNPQILILGGTERGQNYSALTQLIKNYTVKAVLLLPENGKKIAEALKQENFNPPIVMCADLVEASAWVKSHAESDDVVLLSPAAPSYDQFNNFEERGTLFIKLMKA